MTSKQVPTNQYSDEELVERCKQELPYVVTAFELLVERHKNLVFAQAIGMLRHPQDAEDVAQEVFIKIFDALPNFRMDASFKTWLRAITTNACLTHIDRRKRKPWWWLTDDIDDIQESEREDKSLFVMVGRGLEQEELRRKIERVMDNLNEQSRQILQLRYYEELDYQSIADRLGLKLSAAKMRLKRAREEFKDKFEQIRD